jgi:hypothetical protein
MQTWQIISSIVVLILTAIFFSGWEEIMYYDNHSRHPYFSRDSYYNAKYKFLIKYPWWNENWLKRAIVKDIFVIFLDGGHLMKSLIFLMFGAIFSIFLGIWWMMFIIWIVLSLLFTAIFHS